MQQSESVTNPGHLDIKNGYSQLDVKISIFESKDGKVHLLEKAHIIFNVLRRVKGIYVNSLPRTVVAVRPVPCGNWLATTRKATSIEWAVRSGIFSAMYRRVFRSMKVAHRPCFCHGWRREYQAPNDRTSYAFGLLSVACLSSYQWGSDHVFRSVFDACPYVAVRWLPL